MHVSELCYAQKVQLLEAFQNLRQLNSKQFGYTN